MFVFQDQIITALDHVCDLVPSQDKNTCVKFVTVNAGKLIDYIGQNLSPKLFCEAIGICEDDNGDLCTACSQAFETVWDLLEKNATEVGVLIFHKYLYVYVNKFYI